MLTRTHWLVVPVVLGLLAIPSLGLAQTIANPSFESPPEGAGFKQAYGGGGGTAPTQANSSWTFTGGGGIAGNGSAIFSGQPTPFGTQVAILQNYFQGAPGPFTSSFSQTITGFTVGQSYVLTFYDASRTNGAGVGNNPYNVTVTDANSVTTNIFGGAGGFTPPSGTFTLETTAPFIATSTSETLTFNGLATSGDHTTFIDNLTLSTPEPASLGLLATAGLALLSRRRK